MEAAGPDYAEKSDDELLRLTVELDQLTEEARAALSGELKRRHLDSGGRIGQFAEEEKERQHLEDIDLGRLGLGAYGMGKRLYGKWNKEILGNDAHYDATLFAVVWFFPLVPIGTYRISREQGSKKFSVLDKIPLNWSQVVFIWARALAIVVAIPFILDWFLRATH